MWTRAELKRRAKLALNDTYWSAFGTVILAVIFQAAFNYVYNLDGLYNGDPGINPPGIPWLWRLYPLSLLFSFFVTNVLLVGLNYYFIRNHYGETQIRNLFRGFRRGYLNVVGVQFVTGFIVFLWSLLFIIPGIMASYKYSMVPYLLSENPEINGKEARRLSAKMTDGQKWDIFVLDLSFLGWYLLGLICLIVGILLVPPYVLAAKAELYIYLRDYYDLKNSAGPEGSEPYVSLES